MSKNNQWVEFSENVFTRYKKAVVSSISGTRLDPITKQRIAFILMSDWKDYNMETEKLVFNYDRDVIEIYSKEEDRVFRLLNAYLFQSGNLVPFDGTRDLIDTTNAMTDLDISDLAATKNILAFKKKLAAITSRVTLDRLRDITERADRPVSFIRAIEDRMNEL